MKLFELQRDLKSYAYPVKKILACLVVLFLCFKRNRIFCFSSLWIEYLVTAICLAVIIIPSILIIEISICELYQVRENRKKNSINSMELKRFSVDEIVDIAFKNDIIEIDICYDSGFLKIGTSSDSKYSSPVFKNKLYYIGDKNFETLELFECELNECFPSGCIEVFSVDGLPPNKYFPKQQE